MFYKSPPDNRNTACFIIGVSYNGSIRGLGPRGEGSTPSTPTKCPCNRIGIGTALRTQVLRVRVPPRTPTCFYSTTGKCTGLLNRVSAFKSLWECQCCREDRFPNGPHKSVNPSSTLGPAPKNKLDISVPFSVPEMVVLGIENGILTPIYPNQFLISLKLEAKMELGIPTFICGPWCNDSTAVCGTAGSGLIPGVPPICLIGVMAAPQSSKLSVRVQIPYGTPICRRNPLRRRDGL